MHVSMGYVMFIVMLYGLSLMGLDVVLGIHLLCSFGPILCDWKAQTMEFQWKGNPYKLNGLHTQIKYVGPEEMEKEACQGQNPICTAQRKDFHANSR